MTFDGMLDQIPQFWQGVFASIVATILVGIGVKVYGIFSTQAQQSKRRKEERLEELRQKMNSPDSVLRVEGYFITLFTLLKYLFIASILWVSSWVLEFVLPGLGVAPAIAIVSLVFYYSGLKWLYATLKATEPVYQNLRSGDLVLHRAVYGVHGEGIDVTSRLASQMLDGRLKIIVGNNLGEDPCPGQPKELRVDFSYQGQEHHRIVPEGEILSLP